LTKLLIVLLTLSSIFLCGIVVTYVSSAQNFKVAYENADSELKAKTSSFLARESEFNTQMASAQRKLDELGTAQTRLEGEKSQLQADLAAAQRSSLAAQERLSNLAGVVNGLNQTVSSMDQSLKLAREELDKTRTEQVKDKKNLNEVTAALNEKIVQIDSIEAQRRQLLEQKTALEQTIAKLTGQGTATVTAAITPDSDRARVVGASAATVANLQGKIIEANLQHNLVTVSLGSADGVQVGTRFHVVRGDAFLCDVVITNVDTDKAAGVLELVREQPKIGDSVATNL
jgi:predicted  nucleic acid-binding Zn-ribbon protein